MALDINKTYRAIIDAARERRFISYGEIAEASNESWNKVYRISGGPRRSLLAFAVSSTVLAALDALAGRVRTGFSPMECRRLADESPTQFSRESQPVWTATLQGFDPNTPHLPPGIGGKTFSIT